MLALRNATFEIRFKEDFATAESIRELVSMSTRVIHYSGHGVPNQLVLESDDDIGIANKMSSTQLRDLITTGGAPNLDLVFVSACHSFATGHAFVQAGAKHVVCVTQNDRVLDKAAKQFTYQFYFNLVAGKTVQEAFDIGRQVLKTDLHEDSLAQNESEKFLLLPEDERHDVVLFPARRKMDFERALSLKTNQTGNINTSDNDNNNNNNTSNKGSNNSSGQATPNSGSGANFVNDLTEKRSLRSTFKILTIDSPLFSATK
ncbi:hypothetical protein RFI_24470, partial [Reticulomyxa filosa]